MVSLGQWYFRSGYPQSSWLSLLKEGDGLKTRFAGQAKGLSEACIIHQRWVETDR